MSSSSAIEPETDASNANQEVDLSSVATLDSRAFSHLQLPSPLRAYQWQGVAFLARSEAALLADEMGLGKTVQAIIALKFSLKRSQNARALLVVPASLALNWHREISKWAPELVCRRIIGDAQDRLATYLLPIQLLISTYDQIRSDALQIHPKVKFDYVILDEAQRIKNRHSQTALSCRLLRRKTAWALTGTPIENNIEDLVSISTFLKPGSLHTDMPPRTVRALLGDLLLRRTKAEVVADIPPIIVQELPLELTQAQDEAYKELWLDRQNFVSSNRSQSGYACVFSLLTKLKQLCNFHPESGQSVKLSALTSILSDLSQPTDKIIVFSQYVETLNFISERLRDFPHGMFHGQFSMVERDAALSTFKNEPGPRALLMSIGAGAVGLNIQEASHVVLFDRWWNPAIENQAINRAHRLGRNRPLYVVRFLVQGTVEEKIDRILRDKQTLFDSIFDSDPLKPPAGLSREDLTQILQLATPVNN